MYPIYKYSKYNINIEIDNNRKIIYNSFSQAVSVLETALNCSDFANDPAEQTNV